MRSPKPMLRARRCARLRSDQRRGSKRTLILWSSCARSGVRETTTSAPKPTRHLRFTLRIASFAERDPTETEDTAATARIGIDQRADGGAVAEGCKRLGPQQ